jgi:enoyl-[acyl-carrier protein] reductase I
LFGAILLRSYRHESLHFDQLAGKRGLIVGIANDASIAAGCAAAFAAAGAELAATYLNEKARPMCSP